MSRILVLGDIHGKIIWRDIIAKENPDLTIFLGDYVSTHGSETAQEQIDNLLDILKYKEENSDKVILLRGNHDNQHLGYSWAECSGYNRRVAEAMREIKEEFLNKTQWVYPYQADHDKFFLFSHAGVSNTWLNNVKKATKISCIADINTLEPSELFGFIPSNSYDYCGESITQSCTWIRPDPLIWDMPEGITQIVGHTPIVKNCTNVTEKMRKCITEDSEEYEKLKADLWLCDTLNNKSYLMIEDGICISKTL